MEKILVMNRQQAIKFSYNLEKNKKYAIISISEMADSPAKFKHSENLINVLPLHFDDVDETKDGFYCMSKSDAKKIVQFVTKLEDKFDVLIVHCLAGRSRSSGVAAAICKWKWNKDEVYFKEYTPNRHCYHLLLNEFMKEN